MIDWKAWGYSRCGIYVIAPEGLWPSKIGIAIAPLKRLSALQTSHWKELKIAQCWWAPTVNAARKVEKKAHEMLRDDGALLLGEWFDRHPTKAAEVVEFAASSVGVEISSNVEEPDLLEYLHKQEFAQREDHRAGRDAEAWDNEDFARTPYDPFDDGLSPEQRWERALQDRG